MATEDLITRALRNSSTGDIFKKSYSPSVSKIGGGGKISKYGFNQDTDTSDGLYSLADSVGLGERASHIVAANSGEQYNKFLSGGFISDIFDVWNTTSYGVVGMLKGKTFMEGIEGRESFSDKDALGKFGLMGVLTGIGLDIATDPMTYISPWKVLSHVPGVAKTLRVGKEAIIGKRVIKEIEGTELSFSKLEGGNRFARELFEKFQWMFGADPVFKESYERMLRNKGIEIQNASKIIKDLSKIDPKISEGILIRDADGRFKRKSLSVLKSQLDSKTFDIVKPVWDKIDDLSKQLADLGVLGEKKFEETVGVYLRSSYAEYELATKKGLSGFKSLGLKATETRKAGLTAEKMKELGQIENPSYLLFDTMLRLIKDVQDSILFKAVNERFSTNVAQEGFVKLPETKRLQTSFGASAELKGGIEDINKKLNPLFFELKRTFKADKKVLLEIDSIEKELISAGKMQGEELTKFFGGDEPIKEVTTNRKLGIIEERFEPLANAIKKFDTYEEFIDSKAGIELQKLWHSGVLERHGFSGDENVMREFFDLVKSPFKEGKTSIVKRIKKEKAFEAEWGFSKTDDVVRGEKRGIKLRGEKDISGEPLKSRILHGVRPEPNKLFVSELSLLAKKIQDFNKGFKTGARITGKQIRETQGALIKIIEKNFRVSDRGKFLKRVRNATNPSKLDDLVKKLSDDFTDIELRVADKKLEPHLKKTIELQKRVENLLHKSELLTDIDKKSIDDSFISLEKQISDLQFSKEDLLEMLNINKMSSLAGKYVPENIAKYLDEVINPSEPYGSRIIGEFKYMKVVLSLPTHVRNIISNTILNWWKLGIGPWRLDLYSEAIKQSRKGGKFIEEAKTAGYGADTMAANELKGLLDDPSMSYLQKGLGTRWLKVKKFMGNIYQEEENVAKLTAFIYQRKKGIGIEEAWKAAESATFNYAQVTPFVRKMRTALWGVPFITFPIKATPVAIETAFKTPGRVSVFGKIKNGIENASDIKETERERATEPSWVKNGFYFKLPWKDGEGRSAYFDLTYIIPFGDILSGQLFERPVSRKTGTKEAFPVSLASKNPVFQFLKEVSRNETFTGNKIWKESDSWESVSADISLHLAKTFLPPQIGAQIPVGYDKNGNRDHSGLMGAMTRGGVPNQKRNVTQEIFSYLGMKVQPMDADINESINEYNKVKGLRTLLEENGVIKTFSKSYIPK